LLVGFLGSEDMAKGLALAGMDAVSPKSREAALDALGRFLRSGQYALVVVGQPWSEELKDDIVLASQTSGVPIVSLGLNQVDLSAFNSALQQILGLKLVRARGRHMQEDSI